METIFYATPEEAGRDTQQGAAVVVIDVLRGASTVVSAMDNGAASVIPVEDIETALRLAPPAEQEEKLLAGERKCLPIEGFQLGNSPGEFTGDVVGGKTVVLTTTNMTRAVVAAAKAGRLVVCAIVNVSAVAEALRREPRVVVLCSGFEGRVAIEDLLCGGMLLSRLGFRFGDGDLDDAARLALLAAAEYGDRTELLLRSCEHGRRLLSLGFERDILYCARTDCSGRVPEMDGGAIR
ncbi:MAG: 2-phosphosulfolactate phosphatase [Candidatus Krumholzibacteriota bacterium]|nr:2-phosphosulfolactate phosphatase [Candidatus Krumholzibacteriota bacterium]